MRKYQPTNGNAFSRRRSSSSTNAASAARLFDDIAGKLGVTKPFIYTHFRSKVELLEAICRPTIEKSLAAIADAAEQRGSASERLFNGVVNFTKVVLQRQANIAVYFREEKSLSEAGLGEINAMRKAFDRVLSDLLDEGVNAGEFHIADIRVAALAIGGMVSWAYTWYQPGGRLSIDDVGAQMARFAVEMVGVRWAEAVTTQP